MLRRCHGWDYRGRGIYMVTLTLRDRSRPLLGRLVTDSDAEEVCLRAGRLRAEARSTGPYSPLEP